MKTNDGKTNGRRIQSSLGTKGMSPVSVRVLKYCADTVSHLVDTVLSINRYTPFEKYYFKQYLNAHKNNFQNVDNTKFYMTSV